MDVKDDLTSQHFERVKFFSSTDLGCVWHLRIAESIINEYIDGKIPETVDEYIKVFNIKQYFDKKLYLDSWSAEERTEYTLLINKLYGSVARFFKSICDKTLVENYKSINCSIYDYTDDFWALIEKFESYDNISEIAFDKCILKTDASLQELLHHKKIVMKFGNVLKKYLILNDTSPELLLDQYEVQHIGHHQQLFFPNELTSEDKENIINNYLDGENPNLNYVRLISRIQSNPKKIDLNPMTNLKARKLADEMEKSLIKDHSGFLIGTQVSFSNDKWMVYSFCKSWVTKRYYWKMRYDWKKLLNGFLISMFQQNLASRTLKYQCLPRVLLIEKNAHQFHLPWKRH